MKGMTLHRVTSFLLEVERHENRCKNVNIWFNTTILITLQPNLPWSKDYVILECDTVCKNGKGKAIPLQARTGHEGSRKLRLPHFKTIGT
jgi:hypothetical protein